MFPSSLPLSPHSRIRQNCHLHAFLSLSSSVSVPTIPHLFIIVTLFPWTTFPSRRHYPSYSIHSDPKAFEVQPLDSHFLPLSHTLSEKSRGSTILGPVVYSHRGEELDHALSGPATRHDQVKASPILARGLLTHAFIRTPGNSLGLSVVLTKPTPCDTNL